MIRFLTVLLSALTLCAAGVAQASPSMIERAEAVRAGETWRVSVTLRHPDTGWDHYADGWEVQAPDGTVLGMRVMAHPHETEQPFTRSLGGVAVPQGVIELVIRARCNTDGYTGQPYILSLPD